MVNMVYGYYGSDGFDNIGNGNIPYIPTINIVTVCYFHAIVTLGHLHTDTKYREEYIYNTFINSFYILSIIIDDNW